MKLLTTITVRIAYPQRNISQYNNKFLSFFPLVWDFQQKGPSRSLEFQEKEEGKRLLGDPRSFSTIYHTICPIVRPIVTMRRGDERAEKLATLKRREVCARSIQLDDEFDDTNVELFIKEERSIQFLSLPLPYSSLLQSLHYTKWLG